jgi:hypothetical protein
MIINSSFNMPLFSNKDKSKQNYTRQELIEMSDDQFDKAYFSAGLTGRKNIVSILRPNATSEEIASTVDSDNGRIIKKYN